MQCLLARTLLGIIAGFVGLLVVGLSSGAGSGAWLVLLAAGTGDQLDPSVHHIPALPLPRRDGGSVFGLVHRSRAPRLDLLTAWTLLMPVIGIGVSLFLPGERPPPPAAAGIVLVLGSLWLVLRRPRPRTASAKRDQSL